MLNMNSLVDFDFAGSTNLAGITKEKILNLFAYGSI